MIFSLSTRWNAGRHSAGEPMLDEILALGIRHVELGYDLTLDLVPGVRRYIESGTVTADSVHNFCPVPLGAPFPHPELFTLASSDPRARDSAAKHTERTIRFAAEVGARCVVLHAGNVDMKPLTPELIALQQARKRYEPVYDRTRMKAITERDRRAGRQIAYLIEGIARLLPVLAETRVALALEILPSWEAIPTEVEMERVLRHFDSPWVRYWHDTGHAQIRENLGFSHHIRWLSRLMPWLAGMHVHDVAPPAHDHLVPPQGRIHFAALPALPPGTAVPRVLEPDPAVTRDELLAALRILEEAWDRPAPPPAAPIPPGRPTS
jgi:sugar phosphate isomerase/epimerase